MDLRARISGLLIVVGVGLASPARAESPASVEVLGWLTGCWARVDAEPGSGEQWSTPAGGTLLGTSRTVRDGQTREYEFVVIRRDEDGVLAYFAHPSGQEPAVFRLDRLGDREVEFANPAHDFPQRVGYRQTQDDTLLAWIEGPGRDGQRRVVEFPMRRTPCDARGAPPAGEPSSSPSARSPASPARS